MRNVPAIMGIDGISVMQPVYQLQFLFKKHYFSYQRMFNLVQDFNIRVYNYLYFPQKVFFDTFIEKKTLQIIQYLVSL